MRTNLNDKNNNNTIKNDINKCEITQGYSVWANFVSI